MSVSNATPNRATKVYFDVPDSCLTSRAWGIRRNGPDISLELGEGALSTNNVMVWPTGAITLKFLQKDLASIAQNASFGQFLPVVDAQALLKKLVAASILAVENVYAYASDLPGMPALGSGQVSSGSPYIVKRIPAGGSYNGSIASGTPGFPVYPEQGSSPLDRVAESTDVYGENQGWFLSWTDPGHAVSYPSYTWAFYFGQFVVAFTGSGIAELYQQVDGVFSDPVKTWRYARAGQISGTAHSMAIFPHMGPDGTTAYIAFSNCQVDQADVNGTALITTDTSSTPGDAVYAFPQAVGLFGTPSGLGPGVVTQAAPFRVDIARDLGLKFQVSLLAFPTTGALLDGPANLPCLNPLAPVTMGIDAAYGGPYTIEAQLYDGDSPALYDPDVSQSVAASFQFSGDGFNTPILWGYSLNRPATSDIYAPGQFTGGNLRSVHLSGYSGDPTQENGTLTIDDPRGELTALLTRGQFSVLVTIEHTENGTVYETPVFSGYVNGPEAHRRSKPGRVYPSPYRHLYTLPLVGNWLRLSEAVNHGVQQTKYYQDLSVQVADGPNVGWKATDAIYDLLLCCGLTPSQINLPDLPVRLWQAQGDKVDQYAVETAADYAELAQKIASSYLGLNLCYDLPSGQWILVQGTPEGAPPLYSFYTGSPQEAGITSKTVVPTAPGAYGPSATYITEFRVTTVPPDFTAIHVSTGVAQANVRSPKAIERWIYNYNAFQVPGGVPPNHGPNNPDYFGRLKEAEIIDPSLGGGTDAETQAAVDWTAKRVYDFACHAQRLAHFESPLVFVLDPDTNLYRLPRYMDPIQINGTYWIVKTCVPHYEEDNKQMATWEVIQPIAGQAVPVGTAVDRLVRTASDRQASKATGHIHHSGSFGNLATPAHATSRFRDLPRSGSTPYPIQDPVTGQFYYQLGYSPLGSGPLQ